jgi:hypothetical protein
MTEPGSIPGIPRAMSAPALTGIGPWGERSEYKSFIDPSIRIRLIPVKQVKDRVPIDPQGPLDLGASDFPKTTPAVDGLLGNALE